MTHSKSLVAALLVLAAGLAVAAPAHAQRGSGGLRFGVSIDPDQVYFGAHANAGPVADRLWFRPNAEVGFGDGITLLALNPEFAYWLKGRSAWQVYLGGGPAINLYSGSGDSEMEAGLNLLIGCEHHDGFFFELKVGALRSPDIRIGVGITFR